ncbi:hypothetical protein CLOM_g9957 [Closterium sp. NIES-68]|nr:hypothetical protein CLOM_g9957 [Closterium sp. NIES-68]GJP68445.1 hypothetical protein CLOP_g25151 [Closterium sp. NIES-67]
MLGVLTGLLRGRAVPAKGFKYLTAKRGPKNYYKGTGSRTMGRHTKKGGYILMEEKMPTYLVPDLTNCQLKPYVSHTAPKKPPTTATGATPAANAASR